MVPRTTMRRKDMHPSADQLANRLDQALMLEEIVVVHGSGILLGPLSVQRPCSHIERTSRCPGSIHHVAQALCHEKGLNTLLRVHVTPGVLDLTSCLGMAKESVSRCRNTSVSHLVFMQGWGEETRRQTRQRGLQLPPKAALTDPDADITNLFPDAEIATPWIDCLDKTHFTTQK